MLQRRQAVANLPVAFTLGQNQPNPSRVKTSIKFALPVRSHVLLAVFDVNGRRIRNLTNDEWAAGYHTLDWDGRNTVGQKVGGGIYLYRMEAGSFRSSRKVVVLP